MEHLLEQVLTGSSANFTSILCGRTDQPFYRKENWGSGRWRNWPKAAELVSDETRMQTFHSINKYLLSSGHTPGTVVQAAAASSLPGGLPSHLARSVQ